MTVSVPKPTVISAGRTYADLIFAGLQGPLRAGTETYCTELSFHPGGGAFITAAHLAAYGVDAHLMSSLPAAPFAEPLRARIRDLGVDISASRDAPTGTDPQITVAMVESGDRTFLTRRDGPALPDTYAEVIANSGAQHLHVGELATLAEYPDLVRLARNAGMTISLETDNKQRRGTVRLTGAQRSITKAKQDLDEMGNPKSSEELELDSWLRS